MSRGVAYRSDHESVTQAWEEYLAHANEIRERRNQFSDRYGRRLMVNRLGFGHGTRVVGLEILEDDKPGDLVGPGGEFRVPKNHERAAKPNIRRKAGKSLEGELRTLTIEGPQLPGMPDWTLVGMRSLSPALMLHDDAVWAFWGDDITADRDGEQVGTRMINTTLWTPIPLSQYYTAKEAYERNALAAEAEAQEAK